MFLLAVSTVGRAQFTFTTNNGAITLTGYSGTGGNVVIPETTNGYPVTSIGDWAFFNNSNNSSLTNVIIPMSVTSIGADAFDSCISLASISIPDSVTNIGDFAFYQCASLTDVSMGRGVISLGQYGDFAFFQCDGLQRFWVDPQNLAYSSVQGVLFDKNLTTIVEYPAGRINGDYVIPNSVINIESYAFNNCSSLANVVIGEGIRSISANAFNGVTSLTNVLIPNNVTSICDNAFLACGLTSISLPASIISIGGSAFASYGRLTSIIIPDSVTSIGNSAFSSSGLVSITIGNGVSTIPSGAFFNCAGLTNVSVGNNVNIIEGQAFAGCMSLRSITFPPSLIGFSGFDVFGYLYESPLAIYFRGSPPWLSWSTFFTDNNISIYYLSGSSGWGPSFAGFSTTLWLPELQTADANFGVQSNQFGFSIHWASGQTVVVDACTNLSIPDWQPVQTNKLVTDSAHFSDPQWTNYPSRYYRLRSP